MDDNAATEFSQVSNAPGSVTMVQWVDRPRADHGVSIQIKWRQEGRWQSETFTDPQAASEFRSAVAVAGNRWPTGWVKGEGWQIRDSSTIMVTATFADAVFGINGYFKTQDRRLKRGKIKPYTLYRYMRDYELHLAETFGRLAVNEIDTEIVMAWVDEQIDAGAASKSIRNRHGLLSSIMKHAQVRMALRSDNPCDLTELPEYLSGTAEIRQVRFFQPAEWALFRSCLEADFRLPMDVALATGIRWGELSALRICDVTFSGRKKHRQANIHISRAWSRRAPDDRSAVKQSEGETATWVLGSPKSKRTRWVALMGDVARHLESNISGRAEGEYIFCTSSGRPWRYPDFHTQRWTPAKAKAANNGLARSITPHMLRHTAVVWSLAAGVQIQIISEMIGHTSLQMTYDIYGGLINLKDPSMARAMASAMLESPEHPIRKSAG